MKLLFCDQKSAAANVNVLKVILVVFAEFRKGPNNPKAISAEAKATAKRTFKAIRKTPKPPKNLKSTPNRILESNILCSLCCDQKLLIPPFFRSRNQASPSHISQNGTGEKFLQIPKIVVIKKKKAPRTANLEYLDCPILNCFPNPRNDLVKHGL